jgi:hypothetical protein
MNIKPHIFIGSSTEGLEVAVALKAKLASWAKCDIWNEPGIFELGKGYLENLVERLSLYEYGIMIATGDDETTSRGDSHQAPRDNIVFELGLFIGRLGRERAFCVLERGIKLPSDLFGVSLPHFPRGKGTEQDDAINKCASVIKLHVESKSGIFDGGIFPAVPLAFGYYQNFVEIVCKRLWETKKALVADLDTEVPSFEMVILIPDDLDNDMKQKVAFAKGIQNWQQISVKAPDTRAYDFYADVTIREDGHAVLKDVPTTLQSLHQTIQEFIGSSKAGRSQKEVLVEEREIRRFKAVLDYLIQRGAYTRNNVRTEIVDI